MRSRPNSQKLGSRPGRPGPWIRRSSFCGSCAQEARWHRCSPCSVCSLRIDTILSPGHISNVLGSALSDDPPSFGHDCGVLSISGVGLREYSLHYTDHIRSLNLLRWTSCTLLLVPRQLLTNPLPSSTDTTIPESSSIHRHCIAT